MLTVVEEPMPTYEYRCEGCERTFDVVQSFKDDPLTVCEVCGGRLRKVYAPVGIVFKGSGFYKTDSRQGSKSPARTASEASKSTESKSTESTSTESSSSESTSKAPSTGGGSTSDTANGTGAGTGTKSDKAPAPAATTAAASGSTGTPGKQPS